MVNGYLWYSGACVRGLSGKWICVIWDVFLSASLFLPLPSLKAPLFKGNTVEVHISPRERSSSIDGRSSPYSTSTFSDNC